MKEKEIANGKKNEKIKKVEKFKIIKLFPPPLFFEGIKKAGAGCSGLTDLTFSVGDHHVRDDKEDVFGDIGGVESEVDTGIECFFRHVDFLSDSLEFACGRGEGDPGESCDLFFAVVAPADTCGPETAAGKILHACSCAEGEFNGDGFFALDGEKGRSQ